MNKICLLGMISLVAVLLFVAIYVISFQFTSCTQQFPEILDELAKDIKCFYQ